MIMLMSGWISEEIQTWSCSRALSGGNFVRNTHFFLFKCFCEFYHMQMFFNVHPRSKYKIIFDDTDVGPYRPPGTSPIQ
jgi:hypothetical protein